ncbi:MAG: chorismate synthase [Tannerella sp.]|jgi:chorismate synthase|nr:chorismate synthase [Tannerella sp.]
MNTFGNLFRLTSFGESHGAAMGGVIDGCPAGIVADMDFIRHELGRRKPGQSSITTQRQEDDRVEFLSGIFEGQTTGAPIGFIVRNKDQRTTDYEELKHVFRPSHADFTYQQKYGIRDPHGGGRSSARETITRCVGGAIAKLALSRYPIKIQAYTSQIAHIRLDQPYLSYDLNLTETNGVRCPDPQKAAEMEAYIKQIQAEGDTVGGVVTCVIQGVPAGLGEPVFGKLHAALASAILSIHAAKGFDYGMGFDVPLYKGSEQNDPFYNDNGQIRTRTNHSGGIQGGISNGEDIFFRVAFKAVPTLMMEQSTVDMDGNETLMKAKGRHDPCVLPRAVPVVEAMAAMTVLDYLLLSTKDQFPIQRTAQ